MIDWFVEEDTPETEERREKFVLEKIKDGQQLWGLADAPKEYKDLLFFTLDKQYRCEERGGINYFEAVHLAPTAEEKENFRRVARQELRHGDIIADLIRAHYGKRVELAETVKEEKNILDVFRHPDDFDSWEDVIVFNILMDLAADIRLDRFKKGSFGPWTKAIEEIEAEEKGHVEHGIRWFRILTQTDEGKQRIQEAVSLWLPRVLRTFGNLDDQSKSLPIYQKYGFLDSNDAQREQFMEFPVGEGETIVSLLENMKIQIPSVCFEEFPHLQKYRYLVD